MYRFQGKARRMTLGTYPALGLADARVQYAKAKQSLQNKADPGAQKIARRRRENSAETINDLAEEYLEKWARPRKRSAAEDERILRKDVLPAWGMRKAKDITRRDVILLLDKVVDRGSPIMANRTLAVVRRMFNFAVARDILGATPATMVQAPAKENQRERVLSPDEIRVFWNGLSKADMSPAVRLVLKLELVTAQRKGELVGAARSEIDFEESVWTIAAERSKNGKAHRVPLSSLALELIRSARDLAGGSPWLFPSPRGDGSITPESVNHALRKALLRSAKKPKPAIELKNVTPHDLRRTAASGMTSLGIGRLTVAKVLNHVETGVTAVYDRHGYDAEKRSALNAWADHLEGILAGEGV
jgi:integrase